MINDQQCNHIARKHGLEPSPKLIAALKETFSLGKNSEVIRIVHKKEEKAA
jgi:hypothetical protein